MAITQTIATLPAVLNDSSTFYEDIAARNNSLVTTILPSINAWATQANTTQTEINAKALQVAAQAVDGGYSQDYINTNFVGVNNAQTIAGIKTFSLSPIVPTPPQFSSSVSVATTAFVQNALGNYNNTSVVNGSLNLTASYAGGITIGIMPSTGETLSLPSASSLASGAKFTICNFGNYSFGISLSSGDMYSGFTTGNNYILGAGDTVEISVELTSGLWNIVGGSSILKYSSTFISAINAITNEASKTTNGWFKDKKTGLIFQWGATLSDAVGYSTFTHPVTFPNAKLAVIPTAFAPGAQRFTVTIDSSQNSTQWSKVSCWNGDNQSNVAGQVGVSWLVVGH